MPYGPVEAAAQPPNHNLPPASTLASVRKSEVTGQELKEAQHINQSLSTLGDVMHALDSKAKHVPYRNSKLTYLLQGCLGGPGKSARTAMVVTCCPTAATAAESHFALQFATRVRNISLDPATRQVADARNLEENFRWKGGRLMPTILLAPNAFYPTTAPTHSFTHPPHPTLSSPADGVDSPTHFPPLHQGRRGGGNLTLLQLLIS